MEVEPGNVGPDARSGAQAEHVVEGAAAVGAEGAAAAGLAPLSVGQLIQVHGLTIDVEEGALPASGVGGVAAGGWRQAREPATVPASPMSGDVLPAMLLSAMRDRRELEGLGDEEMAAMRARKQKQKVVDLWLEEAMVLQSRKEAVAGLEHRRHGVLAHAAFVGWRRWLDQVPPTP